MRSSAQTLTFLLLTMACLIGCAVVWQYFVMDKLYNCTDSLGLPDFLVSSSHWVHNPVPAAHVASGRSMSEPDVIKQGWSLPGLIFLRWALVVGSIAISFLISQSVWTLSKSGDSLDEVRD